MLHESGHQIVPSAPLEDFGGSLLRRSDTITHCPLEGDASYRSLHVGAEVLDDAIWGDEQPLASAGWLAGLAALRWNVATAWFIEDEVAFGPHLRDPSQRVDVYEAARPVTVRAGGRVIASTERPKPLFETSLPARIYVPRADVLPGILAQSPKTYEMPLPEAHRLTGDVCFVAGGADVDVGQPTDGLPA